MHQGGGGSLCPAFCCASTSQPISRHIHRKYLCWCTLLLKLTTLYLGGIHILKFHWHASLYVSLEVAWPGHRHLQKVSMVLVFPCSEGPWQFAFSPHTPITSSSLGMSCTPDSSQFHMYKGELMLYSSHTLWYCVKKLANVMGLAHMA